MYEYKHKTTWVYKNNKGNTERYLLGVCGSKPLICIGLNPSDAKPNYLDSTVMKVERISKDFRFYGWMMLNLCPTRNKDPKEMKKVIWNSDCKYNEKIICSVIEEHLKNHKSCIVLAAWGQEIGKSKQLESILISLINNIKKTPMFKRITWMQIIDNGQGHTEHPRHPGRTSNDICLKKFDINAYLKEL